MTPYDPEPQPPIYDDSLSREGGATTPPPHTTVSGTEAAQDAGVDVGEGTMVDIDPDERTDLEGPDELPENDGTVTHPSFGAGVPLYLGMGTGAGSDESEGS